MSLSKARLGRMRDVMAGYVERGIGTKAVAGGEPIQRDTIFRIASLTKPIAAAATMILVEECRLRLDEPVDRLLPELAHRTVLKRLAGPLGDTVPANRPITVSHPEGHERATPRPGTAEAARPCRSGARPIDV